MIVEEKVSLSGEKFNRLSKHIRLSLLKEGKAIYINARLMSMSMYPFIKNGDRIKIEAVNKERIQVGNIVAMDTNDMDREDRKESALLIHRVVKITGCDANKTYFTKGDANKDSFDEPVTTELILGKITQIKRKGLEINFELPLWKFLNKIIAKFSLRYPKLLSFLLGYINIILEWRFFLVKLKNRFKKGTPLLYNTEELLLLCVEPKLDEELKIKAKNLIKEGLYWKNLCELAITNGITILVYNLLKRLAEEVYIPEFVLKRLKINYLNIIPTVIYQHKKLINFLAIFSHNKIPVIPLKGTILSKRLYGDIAARGPSTDFDLLIKEQHKEKAQILLKEAGYYFNPHNEIEQWQWQYDFYKPQEDTTLDLHWDITMMGRSKERIEGLWRGTRIVEEDISYYEFKEEELLLYLVAHFISSRHFIKLRYVCDINELLNIYKDLINWDSLINKAKRWKLTGSLYALLKLCNDLFDCDLPRGVLQRLRPNFFALILIKIFVTKKTIMRDNLRRRLRDRFLSYIFLELIEAESVREYLYVFKRVFFPPKQAMSSKRYILRIFQGLLKSFKIVSDLKKT